MKISRNWLQTFFDTPLPSAAELDELITFHSSEIEEVITVGEDSVLDVKVLPDKSAWLLSHRGVAKEVSVITGKPLKHDPFGTTPALEPVTPNLLVSLATPTCDFYSAALVTNVTVGPSPAWLVARLAAIGQRSINNVVDATNYVMFGLGQPLHAFDAGKLGNQNGQYAIAVRNARADESIVTLTGESYKLTTEDAVIVDGGTDAPIGIAGIKGGMAALVDATTTSIIIESAHFDRGAVRQTSKRLRLATDASKRYENGISRAVAPIALATVVKLITDIVGGTVGGFKTSGDSAVVRLPVSCPVHRLRSVLGLPLSIREISDILDRFGYDYTTTDTDIMVTPPFERDDLVIAEDVIEEIGRMYGLGHIVAIAPAKGNVAAFNARHYYAEIARATLTNLGFSEVFTSTFRDKDLVHIKNALASDKSYLRSALHANLKEAVLKNTPHRDLLGLSAVKVFEIGTVFGTDSEAVHIGLGVQTGTSYKAKIDDLELAVAQAALATALGTPLSWQGTNVGVTECSLDEAVALLPRPAAYTAQAANTPVVYQPFSLYPAVSRDIALWVPLTTDVSEVSQLLRTSAGDLCVRITPFDTFIKDDRTSLAFRLVFQSKEKTLAASEVDAQMTVVYDAALKAGFETR